MNSHIRILLKKDLLLFTRDRFYFLITVFGLVMYFVFYFVMPQTMNETLRLAIHAPGIPEIQNGDGMLGRSEGIDLKVFGAKDELIKAIGKNEYPAGIVLPENFLVLLREGGTPAITLYFTAASPEELRTAVTALVNELASQAAGQELLFEMQTEILGKDLSGKQIPWRDRLIPVMVILILGTELMSLASLISTELEQKTIRALLVTPLGLNSLLAEKAILGMAMASLQVILFTCIVGGLAHQTLAMILVLLIGSVLVTGLGFLVASLTRDMMGVTAWGMVVMIIFVIPAIGAMMPGLLADWARIIPSYHLTDAIVQLINYGANINTISSNLLIMLGWSGVFAIIGVITLRRRYSWASVN